MNLLQTKKGLCAQKSHAGLSVALDSCIQTNDTQMMPDRLIKIFKSKAVLLSQSPSGVRSPSIAKRIPKMGNSINCCQCHRQNKVERVCANRLEPRRTSVQHCQ